MKITILTYGSRGDVQPFLPLSVRLMSRGHSVKIAAPARFKSLVEQYGITFVPLSGDPAGPIQRITDGRLNIFTMLREGVVHALEIGKDVFRESAEACEAADLIIHADSHTIDGHTRAHELGIPDIHIQTFPMYAATGDYPNVVLPDLKIRALNYITHVVGQRIIWWLTLYGFEQIHRRTRFPRRKLYFLLDKHPLRLSTPILCAWSPSLLPPSKEWAENVHVTGNFFFDLDSNYQPPLELQDFPIAGSPPVCISFGSMVNREAEKIDKVVREALSQTNQRGIILSGWGMANRPSSKDLLYIESAPHDWLLPRCSMLVHHGGAGTVAAGLRAGIPQVVVPFMTDQPFWARRAHMIGVSPKPILVQNLTVQKLAEEIAQADAPAIRERAKTLGEIVRSEDGVGRAVELIESHARRWNEMVQL